MTPQLEDLAKTFDGQATFLKIDIDKHPKIAEQYAVTGIPVVVYLNKGEIDGAPVVGAAGKAAYQDRLEGLLN